VPLNVEPNIINIFWLSKFQSTVNDCLESDTTQLDVQLSHVVFHGASDLDTLIKKSVVYTSHNDDEW